MFGVAIVKNPLEAETVAQRRERKAKESERSVASSRRSSLSTKETKSSAYSTKSSKTSKFNFFGAITKALTPPAVPDLPYGPLEINVTQSFDVKASEFNVVEDLPSPSAMFTGQLTSHEARSYCELSASPSVSRPRGGRSPSFRAIDALKEERRKSIQSGIFSSTTIESKYDSSVSTIDIISTPNSGKHVNDPVAMPPPDLERPRVSRNTSTLSTCSSLRSEPFSLHRSIPEEKTHRYSHKPPQYEDTKNEIILNIIPSGISTPEVHPISLSGPTSPPVESQPPPDLVHQMIEQLLTPQGSSLPPSNSQWYLRIMERASNQIICQRLSESWEGVESDLSNLIDFEKRLWAMTALRRLDDGIQKGHHLPEDTGRKIAPDLDLSTAETKVVHICDVGASSYHLATTHPNFQTSCLFPSQSSTTIPYPVPQNLSLQSWKTATPLLPYADSSTALITSHTLPAHLAAHDFPSFLRDCSRILTPTGTLQISVIDPMPRNAGPLLQQWTTAYLILGLERRFLATRPAMVIPFWLKDVSAFSLPQIKTTTFSAITDDDTKHAVISDASEPNARLRTVIGRHFYQSLYKTLAPEARPKRPVSPGCEDASEMIRHWWWQDPAIVRECREYGTVFEMVEYTCRKKELV